MSADGNDEDGIQAVEDEEGDDDDGKQDDEFSSSNLNDDYRAFKPVYGIGYWDDPANNYNPCCSVAILAFYGVDRYSDFSIHVSEGKFLEYSLFWPAVLKSSKLLHKVWTSGKGSRQKLANYHAMVTCFEPMLTYLRRHDMRVQTSARIPLKMHVESRLDVHLLSFPNSTAKIIYVILRETAKKTTTVED